MIDNILKLFGIEEDVTYDELSDTDQEIYREWQDKLEVGGLTIEDIKKYVHALRQSVDLELSQTPQNDPKDVYLKARLRNYVLLEAFLTAPDLAREALKTQHRQKPMKGQLV